MNYRVKRQMKRITFYTMVKELGIDKNKYKEVEKGLRNLEGDLLDKYYNVIDNAEDIKMNRKIKMLEIDEWYRTHNLSEEISKMGYTQRHFSKTIDLGNATIYRINTNYDDVSDDVKEEVYDFLTNPMNRLVGKEPKRIKPKEEVKLEEQENVCLPEPKVDIVNVVKEDSTLIKSLQEENERLKRQVYLYEKLIERL